MYPRSFFVSLIVLACAVPPWVGAQFLPPGSLNPAAAVDAGADFFIDHLIDADGVTHAVWSSQHDYSGDSGADSDIWHAFHDGNSWSSPRLVNRYGTYDSATWDDREPSLARTAEGLLYCVWSSNLNGFGWGNDFDILISVQQVLGGPWSDPLPINDASTDSSDDRHPVIAVPANDEPVVLWEGEDPTWPYDREILWSRLSDLGWTSPDSLNAGIYEDWNDYGPISLGSTPDGTKLVAAWAADDGFDSDIFLSDYSMPDYFSPSWKPAFNIGEIPQPWPEGDARSPAVAVHPGDPLSIHVAFSSQQLGESDTDIRYRLLLGDYDDAEPRGFTEVNTDADTDSLDDLNPDICVEPSGSVHVVWQRADPTLDDDVYHSVSSQPIGLYAQFNEAVTVGGQGDADGPGEHDLEPDLECFGEGLLSTAWNSLDDLGGSLGPDWDILHSYGLGRLFPPPQSPHPQWALFDGPGDDDLDPALTGLEDGTVVAVWPTFYPIGNTGSDLDIVWSEMDPVGSWSHRLMPGSVGDSGEDFDPVLASGAGSAYVVFSTDNDLGGNLGTDLDLAYVERSGANWAGPFPVGLWGSQDNPAGSAHDRGPAAIVEPDGTLMVAWAAPTVGIVSIRKTPAGWEPPEILGPSGTYTDADLVSAVTLALDAAGHPMVAFMALDPISFEGRVYWSRREAPGWLPVVDIGAGVPDQPPVLVMAQDEPMLVWASEADVGGAGADADLLTSRLSFQGWTSPEPLLLGQLFDSDTDLGPAGVVANGSLYLAWVSDANVAGTAGADFDILYAELPLDQQPPYLPVVLLADPTGHADGTDPQHGAAVALAHRKVVVAWSHFLFGDWDVFSSYLEIPETPLFADGFETGDTSRW